MNKIIIASIILLLLSACTQVPAIIEDPVINPASGEYTTQKLTVTITSESSATVYYTLDGTNPTDESLVYKGPIEITKSTIVKAITYKPGQFLPSNIISRTYVLN